MAAAVAVLLLLAALLPAHRRPAPVAALAALLLPPALSAAEPLAVVVAGQLGWLAHAWSGTGHGDAFQALDRAALEVSPERWAAEVPLLLLVVAAALAVVATVHRGVPGARLAAPAATPVLAAAVLAGLPALDVPYAAALCSQLALAAAALLGGAELWRRRQRGSAVTVTAV